MDIASSKFKHQLTHDILENCCLHALYKCMQTHNPLLANKFTSSLYNHVVWQCMQAISEQRNKSTNNLLFDLSVAHKMGETLVLNEFLAILDDRDREMVRDRYLNSLTFVELARKYNCTPPGAKFIVSNAIDRMNLVYNKDRE